MGPQRSVAAVVAAGFAVIAAVVVVAWVAMQPRGDQGPKASAAHNPTTVGAPAHLLNEDNTIQVLIANDAVPAGTDLGVAIDQGLVAPVVAPAEILPEDFIPSTGDHHGLVLPAGLGAGVVLTRNNTSKAGAPVAPASFTAECPTDWTGTLGPGERLVFVVVAPVSPGTSVAQAFASGSVRPYAVPAKWVPPTAPAALAPVCTRVAAYALTRGTVLTPSTLAGA